MRGRTNVTGPVWSSTDYEFAGFGHYRSYFLIADFQLPIDISTSTIVLQSTIGI